MNKSTAIIENMSVYIVTIQLSITQKSQKTGLKTRKFLFCNIHKELGQKRTTPYLEDTENIRGSAGTEVRFFNIPSLEREKAKTPNSSTFA